MEKKELQKYIGDLKKLALAICRDENMADEAVGEAMLVAFESDPPITEYKALSEILKKKALFQLNHRKYGNEIAVSVSDIDMDEMDRNTMLSLQMESKSKVEVDYDFKSYEERVAALEKIPKILTGVKRKKRKFVPFEIAREFVRTLGIKSVEEWWEFARGEKMPSCIPKAPAELYIGQFQGYQDWFGTSFYSYEEAKQYLHGTLMPQGIDSSKKYMKSKLPPFMPVAPNLVYKNKGWKGWAEFFGKKKHRNAAELLSFENAKKYIREHLIPIGVDSHTSYQRYKELPSFLPTNPKVSYKNHGWKGWGDYMGTNSTLKGVVIRNIQVRTYAEMREWVRLNLRPIGITSFQRFEEYAEGKLENAPPFPKDMPRRPDSFKPWSKDWISWPDFLGTTTRSRKDKFSYRLGRNLMLEHLAGTYMNMSIYTQVRNKTRGWMLELPSLPEKAYGKDWKGWDDFTGFGKIDPKVYKLWDGHISRIKLPYNTAVAWVRKFLVEKGINDSTTYAKAAIGDELPYFLPKDPVTFYGKQWKGWKMFFQNAKTRGKNFPPYEVVAEAAKTLFVEKGISNGIKWRLIAPTYGFPTEPHRYYKKEWKGWNVFFGTLNGERRTKNRHEHYLTYNAAKECNRAILIPQGIDSYKKYKKYVRKHPELRLPVYAPEYYGKTGEWVDWIDYLESSISNYRRTPKKVKATYQETRDWVHANIVHVIDSGTKWRAFVRGDYPELPKYPDGMPSLPDLAYRTSGWTSWGDFFGTGRYVGQRGKDTRERKSYIRSHSKI